MKSINPRIETISDKKLIGTKLLMSVANNLTGQLWSNFTPRVKEIQNKVNSDKISMQIYDGSYFSAFNPASEFEKWAAVEVSNFDSIPANMDTFTLNWGEYAVFDYIGSSTDKSIFQYIFSTWLPNSDYQLDDRPHFEVLGEKYKNNDPTSEEEIWIPIKRKL